MGPVPDDIWAFRNPADAALIAAAPDMLSALKAAHDAMVMQDRTSSRAFRMVVSAIQLAEGRQQPIPQTPV
jgi:hypothetical protein